MKESMLKQSGGRIRVDTLITHALVVTMDKDFRVIEDGAVAIRDGEVVFVGDSRELTGMVDASSLVDGSRMLLMPGLINTHTHSPMTVFRGFADDLPLKEWLFDYVFPMESAFIQPEYVRAGTRLAIAEMLLSGTTTFNDLYYYVDEMAEVVDQVGMRAVLSESLIDFPAPNSAAPGDCLSYTEQMIKKWQGHPRIRIGVCVHSLYTVAPEWIQRSKQLADRYGTILNLHLAETRWEVDTVAARYGCSPAMHLHKLAVLDSNIVAAHGVHLNDEDIELMARQGVGVAHNPQCNMKLASGVARIPDLLKAGVNVGIGTDGVASNNDLDLIDEARSMAFLHKLHSCDPTVVSARQAVEILTIGGARVLAADEIIGSIEPGKKADLIMLDLDQPHAHPLYNIYSLIVYSLRGADVKHVMVDGNWLVFDRELQTLDTRRLFAKVDKVALSIRRKALEMGIYNGH